MKTILSMEDPSTVDKVVEISLCHRSRTMSALIARPRIRRVWFYKAYQAASASAIRNEGLDIDLRLGTQRER